jgi:Methane oxygenase PmoA
MLTSRSVVLTRILVLGSISLIGSVAPTFGKDWRVTIRPKGAVQAETPVVLSAPDGVDEGNYRLSTDADGASTAAVVSTVEGKRTLTAVLPALSGPSAFVLKKDASPPSTGSGVAFVERGPNLEIQIGGKLFSVYRVDAGAKPFLFPLVGPTGDSYTRAYPMERVEGEDVDHPHQRSFWFTHGRVNDVDFWSEQKNHGTIKEIARTISAPTPVLGRLTTRDDWLGPNGAKVCEDERVLTVYDARNVRILDFAVQLKATEGPLVMGDTKEGMFGLRVASSMDVTRKEGGKIRNAEGLEDDKAWGKPSSWVDYSGPVGGKTVGIAVLNHPKSFRYPTTWHVRTYGLFAANPFGWHDFGMPEKGDYTIPKGESVWFGYRVILHAGDGSTAGLADQFANFATPPTVDWEAVD